MRITKDIWSSLLRRESRSFLLVFFALALACIALSPAARAVTPPPDGGYPNANTAEGDNALFSLTTGVGNTAIGEDALFNNTTGNFNTASGLEALFNNTNGDTNTATGFQALVDNTTGRNNTATGYQALFSNTPGNENTATGVQALSNNTTGFQNTANGVAALHSNTTGHNNTGNGVEALFSNTIGNYNTANGYFALFNNTIGNNNTANGYFALFSNQRGSNNTAEGNQALFSNINGTLNTAIGYGALLQSSASSKNTATGAGSLQNNVTGWFNTAYGWQALLNSTGAFNLAVGTQAGLNLTTGDRNIYIGNQGVAQESGAIRIGYRTYSTNAYIGGIYGVTEAGGVNVVIGPDGHLGTVQSSERFKADIKPMDKASEAILALQPVTFRYKHELDPDAIPQFGLVAEQVEKVNPDLVVRDVDGKVMTVRYEAVNAMLLNEFLKAHRKLDQQQAMIDRQQKQIEALTATVQKVSDQVALSKSAPQLVANP
jgi:hypothetical protein